MPEQMQPLSPEEQEQLRQLTDKEERGEALTWQEGGLQLALLVRAEAEGEQGCGLPEKEHWEQVKRVREHEANKRARDLLKQAGEDVHHQTQGVPELLLWAMDKGLFVQSPLRLTQLDTMMTLEQLLGTTPLRMTQLMDQADVRADKMETPEKGAYHVAQEVLLYMESTLPPI